MIADRVHVCQDSAFGTNIGLIIGGERALLVDTGGSQDHGRRLMSMVRRQTKLPVDLVLTHGHYEHSFGATAFEPCNVWGHAGLAEELAEHGEEYRRQAIEALSEAGETDHAARIGDTRPVLPNHHVHDRVTIDLGDRLVQLMHLGRGHTDHDVVIGVPDVSLVFWGSLIEDGDDPIFHDSFPREWGSTVARLLDSVEIGMARTAVPGHGMPMPRETVEVIAERLAKLAWFLGEGIGAGERDVDSLVRRGVGSGFGEAAVRVAAERQLSLE